VLLVPPLIEGNPVEFAVSVKVIFFCPGIDLISALAAMCRVV